MEGLQRIRIGVYDSGIGGLTVLKQLLMKIPFGIDFFYIYSVDKESIPFCDSAIKDNVVWCNLTTELISTDKESFKNYIRELIISYGINKSKKKSKGRVKGAKNKESDYDPYKDKILESLERKMSIRSILIYIGFGTYSGLRYYIEHRLNLAS